MIDLCKQLLEALELDRNDEWDAAHRMVQSMEDTNAYWIHAYLHRKEGDLGNANYWYSRASREAPDVDLSEEWQTIYNSLSE